MYMYTERLESSSVVVHGWDNCAGTSSALPFEETNRNTPERNTQRLK